MNTAQPDNFGNLQHQSQKLTQNHMRKMMPSLKLILVALVALCLSKPALAEDHASKYQVGTFLRTTRADDGSYALSQCSGGGCSATGYRASHNQHQIETADGIYTLNSPVSVGGTVLVTMFTPGGVAPTLHKGWFMDDLHEGQQVLFYPECNKHNVCRFWLPNPDSAGKEILTTGRFEPTAAKSNTTTLCGTGKLSLFIAAQVCGQNSVAMPSAGPALAAGTASAPVPATAPPPPARPAAAATPGMVAAGQYASDPEEIDRLVQAGEASRGIVLTVPPGAQVSIDGKRVGVSPYAFVLTRSGETPHTITVVKNGYAKAEKNVIPDGTTIHLELMLEPRQQND
jgi:PEGA domain